MSHTIVHEKKKWKPNFEPGGRAQYPGTRVIEKVSEGSILDMPLLVPIRTSQANEIARVRTCIGGQESIPNKNFSFELISL
jgi:hypothetical protein